MSAAKSTPTKPAPAAKPRTGTALTSSSSSGTFGFLVEVNNTPVTVTASQLAAIPTQGLSFSYDPSTPTDIGSLTKLIDWIGKELKVNIPLSDLENMPFIGGAIKGIADAHVMVSQFDVSIAGSQSGTNAFDLQGTIALSSGDQPSLFGLTLVGFAFGVAYQGGS
jgi:hypothetical protein